MEYQVEVYDPKSCAVFSKTKEQYGGLSNMAAGFPIKVNDVDILTSEALYQACRFPHFPEFQKEIIEQKSPMAAKMKSKANILFTRNDWNDIRVDIMRWCLRIKCIQNYNKFGELLETTGNLPIVEKSHKDTFWGAKPSPDGKLYGKNVLGKLLSELRDDYRYGSVPFYPTYIKHLLIYGKPAFKPLH